MLLGDGETWARQRIDFAGLPEMVRTFLQVAAGAADIPVTRLLGQSPAGLSATGDSDTRNYYDMIAARQELDLRPALERLDALILRSEGIDPSAVSFTFRPLWQMDAASQANVALVKAQATAVYAGLGLWPADVTARLVEAQLVADATYPNAAAVFGEGGAAAVARRETGDAFPVRPGFNPAQPRDPDGRWSETGGGTSGQRLVVPVSGQETKRDLERQREETGEPPPDVASAEVPVLKPLPGVAPHGPMSNVPMPIPPKPPVQVPASAPEAARPAYSPADPPAAVPPNLPGIVGPGPFAREAIPAGPSRELNAEQRRENNTNGYKWGCHWCGTKDPGTLSSNFVGDHQPPTALTPHGEQQFIYPHCWTCSNRQGGYISGMVKRNYRP